MQAAFHNTSYITSDCIAINPNAEGLSLGHVVPAKIQSEIARILLRLSKYAFFNFQTWPIGRRHEFQSLAVISTSAAANEPRLIRVNFACDAL